MEGGIASTSSPTTHHPPPDSQLTAPGDFFHKEQALGSVASWFLLPATSHNSWQMEGGKSWVGIGTSGSRT